MRRKIYHGLGRLVVVTVCLVLLGIGLPPARAAAPGERPARKMAELMRASVERHRELCASTEVLKVRPALIPLPPGAVKPAGWLADWAEAAADGITGHLDERHNTFRSAWHAKDVRAPGARDKGTGWPLEQCGYWLDGLVRLGYILDDAELIAKARARLDPVVEGVLRGGPSFIYWLPKEQLHSGFDNWAHSHMGRALVAYYRATGDPRVLAALVRVYRDYPLPPLGNRFYPVNGIVNLDPMLETYVLSGDEQVLRTALAAGERESFRSTVEQWNRGQFGGRKHAVIVCENIRVPALLYPWTGDETLLQATRSAVRWLDRDHRLPYGVTSGAEDLAGIGSAQATETCDMAASMWTFLSLLRITGDCEWSGRLERIFFNAAPAIVDRDFQTHCYYQSPNRINNRFPGRVPGPGGDFSFKPINGTLCCVGNLNRILPNYIMHMWMATPDGGLDWTLYGPCRVQAVVGEGVNVRLESTTAYPFAETVTLAVSPERPAAFALSFRLPAWCARPSIEVNGEAVDLSPARAGFVRVERTWKEGDVVSLRFPVQPRVAGGRESTGAPYASVFYGPLLMALPIPDDGPNRPDPTAPWQYAFDLASPAAVAGLEVARQEMPGTWDWPLQSPLAIEMPAARSNWEFTTAPQHVTDMKTGQKKLHGEACSLPLGPVKSEGPATIRLIPYGSTMYRISMFPITARAEWVIDDEQPD